MRGRAEGEQIDANPEAPEMLETPTLNPETSDLMSVCSCFGVRSR